VRRGAGYAILADGSIAEGKETTLAAILLHEAYHLIGAHGIDAYMHDESLPSNPDGMISVCQNYTPPD